MDVLIALVIVVAVVLSAFRRHPEAAGRARTLRRAAMTFMTLSLVSMGLFVALQDPGGWAWVGTIAGRSYRSGVSPRRHGSDRDGRYRR